MGRIAEKTRKQTAAFMGAALGGTIVVRTRGIMTSVNPMFNEFISDNIDVAR